MNLESFVAGHHGHDSMRDKAKRMLGHELRTTDMHIPESMSSPGRTNMRLFRKGGHASHDKRHAHHSRHHKMSHEQTDLHIPRREKSSPIRKERFSKVEHRAEGGNMRHGGHHDAHRKHTKDGHPKYGIGGFFGDLMRGIPLVNMVTGPIADAAGLKRGGKVHHKKHHRADGGPMCAEGGNMRRGGHHSRHRSHRAEGGEMHAEGGESMRRSGHHKHHGRHKYGLGGMIAGAAGAPLLNKIPKVGKYMAQNLGMFGGLLPFSKGGHAEGGEARRHGGHMRRKHHSDGGEMHTEHHKRGGHHRKHRAMGGGMEEPALIANAKQRWIENHPNGEMYAEGGEAKRRGGKAHHKRHHKADGGEPKYGFGGDLMNAYKNFSPESRQRVRNIGSSILNVGKSALGYAEGGEAMKRGGHHRKHHAEGGESYEPVRGAPFISTLRKGGHMKKHHGHEKHYASGGSVYEREMVGEHPGKKPHHFNYESEMKGEHPVKRAIGGVGKIRHGQATKAGKPVHRRVVKGR